MLTAPASSGPVPAAPEPPSELPVPAASSPATGAGTTLAPEILPDAFPDALPNALTGTLPDMLPDTLPDTLREALELAERQPQPLSAPEPWLGHMPFLAWLIRELRPEQLVALGLGLDIDRDTGTNPGAGTGISSGISTDRDTGIDTPPEHTQAAEHSATGTGHPPPGADQTGLGSAVRTAGAPPAPLLSHRSAGPDMAPDTYANTGMHTGAGADTHTGSGTGWGMGREPGQRPDTDQSGEQGWGISMRSDAGSDPGSELRSGPGPDPDTGDAGCGALYVALCQMTAALPPGNAGPPRLYGIARWPAQSPAGAALTRRARAFAPQARLLCADPLAAAPAFDPGTTELLLADLPLSAGLLTHLRTSWLPLLSGRGVLLLAGTEDPALTPGTIAALDQLLAQGPHLRLRGAGGLVMLLAGPQAPPALARLAALAPGSAGHQQLDQLCAAAAAPYLRQQALQRSRARIGQLEAALHQQQQAASQELAALTRLAEARRQEALDRIRTLEEALSASQAAARAQQITLAGLEDQQRLSTAELAGFARISEQLRQQARTAGKQAERSGRELTALRAHLAALEAEVSALRQSSSWRITAPLRRITGWLRR